MEKAWFYERIFFEVVMVMVKYVKKKKNTIKDTISKKLVLCTI